jgi:hypothetical protein
MDDLAITPALNAGAPGIRTVADVASFRGQPETSSTLMQAIADCFGK